MANGYEVEGEEWRTCCRLLSCWAASACSLQSSSSCSTCRLSWTLVASKAAYRETSSSALLCRPYGVNPIEEPKGGKKRKRNWKWEKTKTVELVHGSREREKRSFALNPPSSLSLPTSFVRPPTPVPLQSIQTHTRTQTAMLRENQRTNQKK